MIDISGVDHVNMGVKDLEASKRFYRTVFGFQEKESGVRGGRRWASSRAEVTVPVVTSKVRSGWRAVSAAIRGSSDWVSPTLAPCSQPRRPGGRARLALP